MANNTVETLIGAVVIAVAGGFLVYAGQNAQFGSSGYELTAKFMQADGISAGGDVRMSGVKVGSVTDMALDTETFQAVLSINVHNDVELPSDTSAKIVSDGLLGGAHIALEPGGSEYMLEPGEEIEYTQGSVNLLDLVGKAIYGGGGG